MRCFSSFQVHLTLSQNIGRYSICQKERWGELWDSWSCHFGAKVHSPHSFIIPTPFTYPSLVRDMALKDPWEPKSWKVALLPLWILSRSTENIWQDYLKTKRGSNGNLERQGNFFPIKGGRNNERSVPIHQCRTEKSDEVIRCSEKEIASYSTY